MATMIKKQISAYLREKLYEQEKKSGKPFNWLLCEELFKIAISKDVTVKDKLSAISLIMDRVEGKPIQTQVNADLPPNPLESIPTEIL